MNARIKTVITRQGETYLSKPDLIKALVEARKGAPASVEEFITNLIEGLAIMTSHDSWWSSSPSLTDSPKGPLPLAEFLSKTP
jgi:hypothetical protein